MTYLDQLKNMLNFQNPLSLFGAASGFGSNLYGSRMGGTKVVGQSTTDQGWGQPLGQILGGVGGFMSGVPGVAGMFKSAPSFAGQTASLAGTGWGV